MNENAPAMMKANAPIVTKALGIKKFFLPRIPAVVNMKDLLPLNYVEL